MAHGMLLFLALPAPSTLCNGLQDARSIAYKTRQSIAGMVFMVPKCQWLFLFCYFIDK
jgi:hypothetical protein